ncbi:MAG: hypothetical protein JWO82_3420, partial [Akkermansiaceae bacterium]|nr:hypothetical protein [Akkermansiaceae bacterium]
KFSVAVAVLLRLFAISWAVTGIVAILSSLSRDAAFTGTPAVTYLLHLIVPIFYLLFALLAWIFATPVARVVMAAPEMDVDAPHLRPAQLYTFGFLILGLYFFLGYAGGMLNWFYFFATSRSMEAAIKSPEHSTLYKAGEQVVPCLFGILCFAFAPKWGLRMARAFDTASQAAQNEHHPRQQHPN